MIPAVTRRLLALLLFACSFAYTQAQSTIKDIKPYRILTQGKQITVRGTQNIKSIMVWTSSGHRIVEQKDINAPTYTFRVGVNEKVFFLMLEMEGEKRYTEKIGIRE